MLDTVLMPPIGRPVSLGANDFDRETGLRLISLFEEHARTALEPGAMARRLTEILDKARFDPPLAIVVQNDTRTAPSAAIGTAGNSGDARDRAAAHFAAGAHDAAAFNQARDQLRLALNLASAPQYVAMLAAEEEPAADDYDGDDQRPG